jgi:cbb3-type cytochrome oxidase subunit 1
MLLGNRFLRHAVIYALLGMAWGLYMAISHEHHTHPGHAHLLLLGWVSMAIFGLFFRLVPGAEGGLGRAIFWLANIGVVVMAAGIGGVTSGVAEAEAAAAIGSIFVFVAMILFAVVVFQNTRRP